MKDIVPIKLLNIGLNIQTIKKGVILIWPKTESFAVYSV
jgi:hypothetical protein